MRHGGNVHRDVFLHSVPQQLTPIAPRTGSSSQMVSHFLQCPGSHGDVFTVICVMVHKGLDSAVFF